MKKLMIAAAVAAFGLAVNAANYEWGVIEGGSVDANGDALESGRIFLFTGTITETADKGGYVLGFASADLITSYAGTADDDWGEFGYDGSRADSRITQPTQSGDNSQQFSLLVISDSSITDVAGLKDYEGYYALYDGESYRSYDTRAGAQYASLNYEDDAILQGDWKTAVKGGGDVPEPTSGLLLLLGVAGLALRRRHA